jgi:antitoxin component of RelBE/YafQ-DinJ toxin-antitoxin module
MANSNREVKEVKKNTIIRFAPKVRAEAEKIAEEQGQTFSEYVRFLVQTDIIQHKRGNN